MEWRHVRFEVGGKALLKGVSGMMDTGRLVGVLGPSGCGKTTLLNVLSGRQRSSGRQKGKTASQKVQLTGSFSVGGLGKKLHQLQRLVAYVFQGNSLPEFETPRDCLNFSALLRLPREVSAEERSGRVEAMLKRLKLEGCADVLVGSPLRKGLSGGEQKRTAVGIELISNPTMLFLDEPLSGLDSYNAHSLTQSLKQLASNGVPVLMTLHQPSSQIFGLLDDLIVLHEGEVVYHGPANELDSHLELLGSPCPEGFSSADHVLCLLQDSPPEEVRKMKDQWLQGGANRALLNRVANIPLEEDDSGSSSSDSTSSASDDEVPVHGANQHKRGPCMALLALFARDLRRTRRTLKLFVSTYVLQMVVISLAYSFLYYGTGRHEVDPSRPSCAPESFDSTKCSQYFTAHAKFLAMLGLVIVFAAVPYAVETLQLERPVFLRERAGGYYHILPYLLSKMCFEIPQALLECLAVLLGTYWLVGLRGNFLMLLLELMLLSVTSSSLFYIFSAACSTPDKANAYSALPMTLQFAFCGLLKPVRELQPWLQWLKWLCPLYHGMGLMGATEFDYVFECAEKCKPGEPCLCQQCAVQLAANDMEQGDAWWYKVYACLAMIVIFRSMAAVVLWRKSRTVH